MSTVHCVAGQFAKLRKFSFALATLVAFLAVSGCSDSDVESESLANPDSTHHALAAIRLLTETYLHAGPRSRPTTTNAMVLGSDTVECGESGSIDYDEVNGETRFNDCVDPIFQDILFRRRQGEINESCDLPFGAGRCINETGPYRDELIAPDGRIEQRFEIRLVYEGVQNITSTWVDGSLAIQEFGTSNRGYEFDVQGLHFEHPMYVPNDDNGRVGISGDIGARSVGLPDCFTGRVSVATTQPVDFVLGTPQAGALSLVDGEGNRVEVTFSPGGEYAFVSSTGSDSGQWDDLEDACATAFESSASGEN